MYLPFLTAMTRINAPIAFCLLMIAVLSAAPEAASSGALRRILSPEVWPAKFECDRDATHSPLHLRADEPATEGKFFKFCYTVLDDLSCDAAYRCCNKTLPVHKVLFNVDPVCKTSVKLVTIDGVKDPGYQFNTAEKYLRVSDVKLGNKICVYVADDAVCRTRERLFGLQGLYSIFTSECDCCPVNGNGGAPPPPFQPGKLLPPPPPGSFPICACDKSNVGTQYAVGSPVVTTNVTPGVNKVCFKIITNSICVPEGPCCNFDLHKVEIEAPSYCSSSLVHSTIDGKFKPRFFVPKPYSAIKVTGIDKPFASANNTEICVFLKGRCTTPADLCPGTNGCQVAVFNNKVNTRDSCCPVFTVPS